MCTITANKWSGDILFIGTGCSAAIYTQISDVEIEVNGIMTYDRQVVKLDEQKFAALNRSVIGAL